MAVGAEAALELPLNDAVVVVDDVPEFAVVTWPCCVSVEVIATDPAGAALLPLGVERLLRAREPMTAIPAKPPVAVTLRASERRRCEWRARRMSGVSAAESRPRSGPGSAEAPPPRITESGAACARARAFAWLRPVAVPAGAAAPALRCAPVGRKFCPRPRPWRARVSAGAFCALGVESPVAPHPGQDRTPLRSLWHEEQ